MTWQAVLRDAVVDAEAAFDRLKYGLHYRLGGPEPIVILTYRGLGRRDRLVLRGRVLERKHIEPPGDNDSVWRNLVQMYRRLQSDEIPHARLCARAGGKEVELAADVEGQFEVVIEPDEPLPGSSHRHTVEVELLGPLNDEQGRVTSTGEVLVPPPGIDHVVVSDVDDTIVETGATSLLKMARASFLGNARTRIPFAGAAAFYRALRAGPSGRGANPVVYVSRSPWNLYDLLCDFLDLNGFPPDPVLVLRNWGISEEGLRPAHEEGHKYREIAALLELLPDVPFLLIGDSGQKDPEIYHRLVERYGARIRAVLIRDVSGDAERAAAVAALGEAAAARGSTLMLAPDSEAMARFAAERGWIAPEAVPSVMEGKWQDREPPSRLEQLLDLEPEPPSPRVVEDRSGPADTTSEEEPS